jgi:hypothetical protein
LSFSVFEGTLARRLGFNLIADDDASRLVTVRRILRVVAPCSNIAKKTDTGRDVKL